MNVQMSRDSFPKAAIALIQSLGYDVYMRNEADSWCYYTDGKRIGYVQYSGYRGFSVTTVHKPCLKCGTGFALDEAVALNAEMLKRAFITAPDWASRHDAAQVVKYRDMDEFLAATPFNKEYKLMHNLATL